MYNRKNLKYITEDDLYFSLLRGSGVYCWNNITDNDPVDVSGRTSCPVFMDVDEAISRIEGLRCGFKATSCPDQLAQALKAASGK